jgi:hypothetical protein
MTGCFQAEIDQVRGEMQRLASLRDDEVLSPSLAVGIVLCRALVYPPSSVVVHTQARESGGLGFETRSGVIPQAALFSVAITPWLINKLAGGSPSFTTAVGLMSTPLVSYQACPASVTVSGNMDMPVTEKGRRDKHGERQVASTYEILQGRYGL